MPFEQRVTWVAPWTFLLLMISTICLVIITLILLQGTTSPRFEYRRMKVDSFTEMSHTEWNLVFCDGHSCVFKRQVAP